MRVSEGISWVASCSEQFDATLAFFRDVMGLVVAREGTPVVDTQFARYAVLEMPGGVMFELFEPTAAIRGVYRGPIIALTVDDLDTARRELEEQQTEILTEVLDDGEAWRWFYFRAPDGNAYLMQQRRTG